MEKTRFSSVEKILGDRSSILSSKSVSIIGLGGVGSWAAEALARTGVGKLTLVDMDDICISNTNRQVPAHEPNYGKYKIDAIKERLLTINPSVEINLFHCFASEKTFETIFNPKPDIIIDAMDSVKDKVQMILYAKEQNIPILICGASGGKTDPTKIVHKDIGLEQGDVLLKAVKRELCKSGYVLQKQYKGRDLFELIGVYSEQVSIMPWDVCSSIEKPKKGAKALDCNAGFGSLVYVTGAFGFTLAHLAVEQLLEA